MLKKDYSTPVILEASNVIDGGKKFEDVAVFLQPQVKELVESLGVSVDDSVQAPSAPTKPAVTKPAADDAAKAVEAVDSAVADANK
ncbi:hypothetical protein IWT140_01690 [Secundilactobacillus pentosiphilus]|uniref:Uncharacterized protein n=1 Tax=Secundilactobacillus pentosiphilus TaxID=1714682 RepID=A0A1Z5IQL7_9LACO|nr:twin-arginine translocase TatA/TatE family subunit [Secundilactobacillus pentosiphilus]GAX04053.1 hypothetical protein IWT140_01690 [Secundilactobacillus pentosiphilus]